MRVIQDSKRVKKKKGFEQKDGEGGIKKDFAITVYVPCCLCLAKQEMKTSPALGLPDLETTKGEGGVPSKRGREKGEGASQMFMSSRKENCIHMVWRS